MFGESESESPRVPSPWDNLISTPPSPVPGHTTSRAHTPSPLAIELIPRLVPEADDGNVEYKLQLLDPSPARFVRLVTQMKWRLLEGGGQAYYELGVADSGDLIGLPRDELEQSLQTLDMMAGEIGASVIVVKEIEVPAVLATLVKRSGEWAGGRREAKHTMEDGYSTGTTETDPESIFDTDVEAEDLSLTVVLEKDRISDPTGVFTMDSELDDFVVDDESLSVPNHQPRFPVDLEICNVFKRRPVRPRVHNHPHYAQSAGGKGKRVKKHKHLNVLASYGKTAPGNDFESSADDLIKTQSRRQNRDRRREDKRKALEARATQAVEPAPEPLQPQTDDINADADKLISSLETLHVDLADELSENGSVEVDNELAVDDMDDDDDVFAPTTAIPSFPTFSPSSTGESHLDIDTAAIGMVEALMADKEGKTEQPRLIVEVLIVRKMALEEAFLDFGGFSLT